MRAYDFLPLRSTIQFDPLPNLAENQCAAEEPFPLYNIERLAEDRYQLSLAIAGFPRVSVTAEQNVITIAGSKVEEEAESEFLYGEISSHEFKRQISLADYVRVKGVTFANGVLKIELVREIPEAMKPQRRVINSPPTGGTVRQAEVMAAY
jgi:molecular chaperone IbpA